MKCRNCKHPRWAEEYPGRPFFGWCDEISDSPDMEIERECRLFEPATNADIIRRMSDEDLAWTLMVWRCDAAARYHGIESVYPDTQQTVLKWLQQPAKEDT